MSKRVYEVYFTCSSDPATFYCNTKREAQQGGRLYIRQWQLDATISRIVNTGLDKEEYLRIRAEKDGK